MRKTQLTIPCHWDKRLLNRIIKYNSNYQDIEVKEIYGALARGPVMHGRSPKAVPDISKNFAVDFRKYTTSLGLKFIYLLNAPLVFELTSKKKEIKEYLNWIIDIFQADALMITSRELMDFIRESYPNIPIYISTIAGIKNVEDLKKYININPSRIVLHHDANRDFYSLQELVKYTEKRNIEIEIMATESCLRKCPDRKSHYWYLGRADVDTPFHTICNTIKLTHPKEFLMANFIRPEDLCIYEKMGIHIFKITGRSKTPIWLPEVVKAYLSRGYKGNLIRLLGIDPSLDAEDWIYVQNESLNGFLEGFISCQTEEEKNNYCEKWIIKLYKKRCFMVKDGSKYSIDSAGSLYCSTWGDRITSIINKEKIK